MLITILIQLNFIFYKADNLTYKFTAKDSSYNIKLNKDYVESFKKLKKYKFEWFGNTSREKIRTIFIRYSK